MQTRTIISTTVALLCLAVILAGCGKGAGNPAASGGGGEEPEIPLEGIIFEEDFEDDLSNWELDFYWSQWAMDSYSGSYCLHANDNGSSGGQADILTAFDFSLCDTAALTWWQKTSYGNMGPGGGEAFIVVEVDDSQIYSISLGNFQFATPWTLYQVSLTSLCGASKVEIAFYYEKLTTGTIRWWIDDVFVTAE